MRQDAVAAVCVVLILLVACTASDPAPLEANADAGTDAASTETGTAPVQPTVNDIYQTGSRLAPNWRTVDGGDRQFVDWWDTQLGTHCLFGPLANGEYRCIPQAPAGSTASNVFADFGCGTPAGTLLSPAGCTSRPPYLNAPSVTCGTRIIPTSGEPIATTYSKNGAQCDPHPNDAPYYAIGAEVTPTQWQLGTLEDGTDDTGAIVKAQFTRGGDGSYGFYRWLPRSVATTCVFGTNPPDTTLRCYPTQFAPDLHVFTDAACGTALFGLSGDTCPAERLAVGRRTTTSADACAPGTPLSSTYARLAADYSGSYSQLDSTAKCGPGSGIESGFVGGDALDPDATFGVATAQRSPAPSRLVGNFAMLPSGARVRLGWFDQVNNVECTFGPASDGSMRCLPSVTASVDGGLYTESTCKTAASAPLTYVAPPAVTSCHNPKTNQPCPSGCTLPAKPAYATGFAPGGCTTDRTAVYAVGDVVAPAYRRYPSVGACVALSRSDEAVYALTVIPPTDLAGETLSYP